MYGTGPSIFWVRWLLTASVGVMLSGLLPLLLPALAYQGASLLLFADPRHMTSFGSEAVRYIYLAHAVLGGVTFGWGAALLLVVRHLFAQGENLGWRIIALSVVAWFIPDTTYSLCSGFWQNAALNLVFAVLFALPLVATYRSFPGPKV